MRWEDWSKRSFVSYWFEGPAPTRPLPLHAMRRKAGQFGGLIRMAARSSDVDQRGKKVCYAHYLRIGWNLLATTDEEFSHYDRRI